MSADYSSMVSVADFVGVVAAVISIGAALVLLRFIERGTRVVKEAVVGLDDHNSPEYRAYRRSSAYRQKVGVSYARWSRRNGE